MSDNDDFIRFLANWALVHETADEGWKAAVARGRSQEPGDMDSGPESFVDGLSAIVAQRKEELKAELAREAEGGGQTHASVGEHIDELRFEIAELRGRFESLQASLDAILERARSGASLPAEETSSAGSAAGAVSPKPTKTGKGPKGSKAAKRAESPAPSETAESPEGEA